VEREIFNRIGRKRFCRSALAPVCEPAEEKEKGDGEERAEHLEAKKVGRAGGADGAGDGGAVEVALDG